MAMAYVSARPAELAEEALRAQTVWFTAEPGEPACTSWPKSKGLRANSIDVPTQQKAEAPSPTRLFYVGPCRLKDAHLHW